jgi:hypothetical protein
MAYFGMRGVQHCLLQHSLNFEVYPGLEGRALLRSYSSTKVFSILIDARLAQLPSHCAPAPDLLDLALPDQCP